MPTGIVALSVVVYQVACTIFWPTPSEAPLLLYPRMSLMLILALCVVGKVIGAIAILAGWTGSSGSPREPRSGSSGRAIGCATGSAATAFQRTW